MFNCLHTCSHNISTTSSGCIAAGRSDRLLDWTTVHHKLPWNVVLLLGSGFALARGAQVGGSGTERKRIWDVYKQSLVHDWTGWHAYILAIVHYRIVSYCSPENWLVIVCGNCTL